ncbi:hypothetical protein NE237_009563 [Protea cynaroides]|uniref:Uncharacterized protein n=1 Tax=Protea cynaroides TaxID=273540 RepID=A0A9Q0KXW3_9MAGN|nr:hypothetical protein NE237_009563 [Protea cynaroides]
MARPDISRMLSDEGSELEACLDQLEATMANGDKKIVDCFDSIKKLKGAMKITLDEVKEDFTGVVDSLRKEIDNFRVVNENLKAKITVLERAVANGGPSQREIPKLRIPKPKPFNGIRDAKVLENFIWQMEQYFKASKMEDEGEKNSPTCWRRIDSSSLWMDSRSGQNRRTRQGVKDLASTLVAAEHLVEFSNKVSDSSKSKQTKSYNKGKGWGEKKDSFKSFRKLSKGKEDPKKTGCFLCDGDHRV